MARSLAVLALAGLVACASEVPGPLAGHYEGTWTTYPPSRPEEVTGRYPYSLDLQQRGRNVDGTAQSEVGQSYIRGTARGATITACGSTEPDDRDRCPASWNAEVTGGGAPGTVLVGRVCNNYRTSVCRDFRVVKQ